MIALCWVVREPDGIRALAICDGMIAALKKAQRVVRNFPAVVPSVVVEAHQFQAACDRDWRFPTYQIRIEACCDTPGRYSETDPA